MKKLITLMAAIAFASCASDNTQPVENSASNGNKLLLLKVDLLTNAFEGGKELEFSEAETFTIGTEYHPAGDFGSIKLSYQETGQPIFAGDIIWMGLGEISYPQQFDAPSSFTTIANEVAQPDASGFETVQYDEFSYYPETIDYAGIWNAIDNLQAVKNYRLANPDTKVYLYLYTPSVGFGNPEEWDWFVMIKN
ncbi:hypothetical protein ACLI1A_17665 [Flavobacterium sp. RHBU_3]|uniref:hypothetical protein n=1 Tax=Flavobacterium sp. RHBU_3 TaxID=3391184 RepID=UPI00398544F6